MKRVLATLLLALLGGLALLALLSWRINEAIATKVDPALYAPVVADRRRSNPRYAFLPPGIPSEAAARAFVHTPGFLQGGDEISLRLRVPAESALATLRELEQSGRIEATGAEAISRERCYAKFGITRRDVRKRHRETVAELPPDFRVFLFQSDLKDIAKNWNHNFIAFTAVSLDRGEIVYHVANW